MSGGPAAVCFGATAIGGTDLFSFLYPSAPTDYIGGSFDVSVPAGAVEVTLCVTTLFDNLVENNEYFKATLSLPDGPGYVVVGSLNVVFVIINDTKRTYVDMTIFGVHACSSIPVQFSTGLCTLLLCAVLIPVQFNPAKYSVTEGVDHNAVIFMNALEECLEFGFTVTVHPHNGPAIGESHDQSLIYIIVHWATAC